MTLQHTEVITYSTAMNSVSKTGNWPLALGLLRQLEERASQCGAEGPNLITYNTAISISARRKCTRTLAIIVAYV